MKIFIPTPLRAYTGRLDTVEVGGATFTRRWAASPSRYPDLSKHLFTDEGSCARL